MKKFRKIIAIGISLIIVFSLNACKNYKSSASESKDKKSTISSDKNDYEECELNISWWGDDLRNNATKEAIQAFMKKYPKIKVKETYGKWNGWEDTMSTQIGSDNAPDVNQINWNWIKLFSEDGSNFLDLNKWSSVIDLNQFDKKYLDMCSVSNNLQAIPVSITGRIFFWNKSTFEKVGIDIPKSYAELLKAGKKFKEYNEEYYPLVLNEYDRMTLMVYYLESVYDKVWIKNGTLNYNEDEIKKGLEFIKGLEDNHVIPSIKNMKGERDTLYTNDKWINGYYGGIWEWDLEAYNFKDTLKKGEKFVVGEYFNDFGGKNAKGGFTKVALAWAISKTCKYPKEAALLVDYLLNDEEAAVILDYNRGIPISKKAKEAAIKGGKLNEEFLKASESVLSWSKFTIDPYFEDSSLKSNDGIYGNVMSGLSNGDYNIDDATSMLLDNIIELLEMKK